MATTYLEFVEVLRHDVRPHQAVVDQVAAMLVVITHSACSCTLVKTFVDVFGGKSQLAEALAERLSWFEHRDDRRWPRGGLGRVRHKLRRFDPFR